MEVIKIFDAQDYIETVPSEFNGVIVTLDGSLKSSLDWNEAKKAAQNYTSTGLKILWQLDFGLGNGLLNPIGHSAQFLSFKLAIEHFCSEIWAHFHENTAGIVLYRGNADFSSKYHWDDEQHRLFENWLKENFSGAGENPIQQTLFCRDSTLEFIELLAGHLPEQLPVYLMLDASQWKDRIASTILLSRDRFPYLQFAVNGGSISAPGLAWKMGKSHLGYIGRDLSEWQEQSVPTYGICAPSLYRPLHEKSFSSCLEFFESKAIPYKLIAEDNLILEWDGLDYLVVSPENLSSQGIRRLRGFCAAGGTVINLGDSLNLPQEISFDVFSSSL